MPAWPTAGPAVDVPVFRATGLTKVYPMGEVEVHALRGIDLELFAGEFVVLLGASGSGKSTLLNILGGLDAPTTGTVECRGHALTGAGDAALTRFWATSRPARSIPRPASWCSRRSRASTGRPAR